MNSLTGLQSKPEPADRRSAPRQRIQGQGQMVRGLRNIIHSARPRWGRASTLSTRDKNRRPRQRRLVRPQGHLCENPAPASANDTHPSDTRNRISITPNRTQNPTLATKSVTVPRRVCAGQPRKEICRTLGLPTLAHPRIKSFSKYNGCVL